MNLNNFFNSNILDLKSVVVSAVEDHYALINYIESFIFNNLGSRYNKKVFIADRYFDVQQVIDLLHSTSLFGDANYIVIRYKTKPTQDQAHKIQTALSLVNNDNFILLICDKLDKKDLSSEWLSAASLFLTLTGDVDEARLWLQHRFNAASQQIDSDAVELIINMNYGNYTQLNQDAERISFLFANDKIISRNDVFTQLTDNSQYNVFALSDAYLSGNVDLSLKIFDSVCQESDSAILTIWTIGEDLRKLLQVKNELRKNQNIMSILPKLRIWGNAIQSFKIANTRLSYAFAIVCLNELSYIDTVVKGLNNGDSIFLLRKLIYNLSIEGKK